MEDTRLIPKATCVLQKMLLYVAAISTETRDLEGQEKEHRVCRGRKKVWEDGFSVPGPLSEKSSLYKGAIQRRDGHLALNSR